MIFYQSRQAGKLPDDWVEANVAQASKKGFGTIRQTTGRYPQMCLCQISQTYHLQANSAYIPFFEKHNLINTCTAWLSIKTLMRKPALDYRYN